MNFLLRLKSWQLFLLFIVPYNFLSFSVLGIGLFLLWISVYVGWIYSIGVAMHALIPSKNKPRIIFFKCYSLLATTLLLATFVSGHLGISNFIITYPFDLFVLFPIGLFVNFSMWMFAARMLESVIQGENVNRSDALKTFFMFWFFPIGVWYIQPAVKRVLEKYNKDEVVEQIK